MHNPKTQTTPILFFLKPIPICVFFPVETWPSCQTRLCLERRLKSNHYSWRSTLWLLALWILILSGRPILFTSLLRCICRQMENFVCVCASYYDTKDLFWSATLSFQSQAFVVCIWCSYIYFTRSLTELIFKMSLKNRKQNSAENGN